MLKIVSTEEIHADSFVQSSILGSDVKAIWSEQLFCPCIKFCNGDPASGKFDSFKMFDNNVVQTPSMSLAKYAPITPNSAYGKSVDSRKIILPVYDKILFSIQISCTLVTLPFYITSNEGNVEVSITVSLITVALVIRIFLIGGVSEFATISLSSGCGFMKMRELFRRWNSQKKTYFRSVVFILECKFR